MDFFDTPEDIRLMLFESVACNVATYGTDGEPTPVVALLGRAEPVVVGVAVKVGPDVITMETPDPTEALLMCSPMLGTIPGTAAYALRWAMWARPSIFPVVCSYRHTTDRADNVARQVLAAQGYGLVEIKPGWSIVTRKFGLSA